jgi:trehalose 6-phosphate phosphatase
VTDPLGPFRERPEGAGVFLDFDGVLSEIVPVPSAARPVAGASGVLERLAGRFSVVAVVSGRSAAELLDWLGPEVEIWGLHGAQTTHAGEVVLSERAEPYRELMAEVYERARAGLADLDLSDLVVEDKAVMVGLHYRGARDEERARLGVEEVATRLAQSHGLSIFRGRKALELRPPEEFSKQAVVLERARSAGLSAALFAGDDSVDLPAFDALDELAGEGLHTVRVAVTSDEVPRELLERGDVTVQGPRGVLELLEKLL